MSSSGHTVAGHVGDAYTLSELTRPASTRGFSKLETFREFGRNPGVADDRSESQDSVYTK